MSNRTPQSVKRKVSVYFTEPSMTEQAHADDVKIQSIMRKYKKTGVIDHVNQYQGTYGDYLGVPDFQEAQQMIAEAQSMFQTIPASIRKEFNNDPGQFVEFMQNPKNKKQIKEYGFSTSHLPSREETSEATPTPALEPETAPEASEEA